MDLRFRQLTEVGLQFRNLREIDLSLRIQLFLFSNCQIFKMPLEVKDSESSQVGNECLMLLIFGGIC